MRVATRSRNARSCVITIDVGCRRSRSSSSTMPSMSRWFVGSSSSSRSGASASANASAARFRSPPDAALGSVASSRPNRCRNSTSRASTRHRSRSSWKSGLCSVRRPRSARLSRSDDADGNSGSCSTSTTRKPSRRLMSPSSRCARSAITFSSDDLPVPLRPMSPMRSPSSTVSDARSRSGWRPNASSASWRASSGMAQG